MIEPTLEYFRELFPEFDDVSGLRILIYIDIAKAQLDEAAWGSCYALAVLYYAAHLLKMSENAGGGDDPGGGGQAGPLTSASAGGLSVGFASPPTTPGSWYFYQTPYGQYFTQLQSQCLKKVFVSSCGGGCC